MRFVTADRQGSFYVDFYAMKLFFFNKSNRIGLSADLQFSSEQNKFSLPAGELRGITPQEVLLYCLPLYVRHSEESEKKLKGKKLAKSLSYDLNDLACKDVNSFGKPK